jgi:hypothetical protein
VVLDGDGRYRLALDSAGRATAAVLDGMPISLLAVEDPESAPPALVGMAIVADTAPLRVILRLRQLTGHPVLLSRDGSVCGVCGEAEILRALCGAAGETAPTG